MDVGLADFDRVHAAFAGEETGKREFQLAVGQEENGLAGEVFAGVRDGLSRAGARRISDAGEGFVVDAEFIRDGAEPEGRALFAEGERGLDMARAATGQGSGGIAEEGLQAGKDGIGADAGGLGGTRGGKHADGADAHLGQKADGLIFDDIRKGAHEQEFALIGGRQDRHHGGEAGIFALGERRLDAGTGVIQDADMGGMHLGQAFGGAGEVEFDDLGRAGADEEQLLDIGTARQEAGDFSVELLVGVGHSGQIAFFEDCRSEARLGEDHHACGRLQKMRAGARANHQKERILHLSVQPYDPGEATEHLALTAFLEDRRIATGCGGDV